MRLSTVMFALAILLSSALLASACGPDVDCMIGEGRHYRIRMPAGHDGRTPIGAIVHAHGYTGNAGQAMQSEGYAALARGLGVALISVKSAYKGWSIPGAPRSETRVFIDELAYFERVLDDAARRFPLDRKRMIATGFSAGGMMVWNLACHRSHLFAGFVPIAGTFWEPIPQTCTTPPASVIHIHGDMDATVPLAGRRIANTKQGSVPEVLAMYARYGTFGEPVADPKPGLDCRVRNGAGRHLLAFCLYKGGHSFFISHVRQAWEMLVAAGKL